MTDPATTPADNNEKVLGKYHDVWMLLLAFALTTAVGTWLTGFYQRRNGSEETKNTLLAAQQNEASRTYELVSQSLDKRLFRWRRLFWAVRDSLPAAALEMERGKYRDAVDEWNY